MAMDAAALSRISFIAPEQIAGATVSAASDIYAWGVCLYVFMTGKLPYTAQKLPELFEEIRRKGADPDPLLMASLPAEFGGILSRCLAADPTRRFGTAAELLRECEPFRKGSAPSADLRALCGDIPEEYDQPKPAAKKKSRAAAAPVIIGSAALLGFAAFFGGRFLHGSGGSEPIAVGGAPATRVAAQPRAGLPAQTPSPPTMAAERPEVAPMQTPAPAAKAPEPPASAARRPAVKAQPAAAAALPSDSAVPGRALLKPADDSSQALLDSFSVLSPELSGEGGIKAPPAARAADSGGLFVYSDPWAAVSVDGREIGMTPLQDPVRLISGAHIVSLVSKGFATLVDTVIVTADSVIRKRYRLETNR
jgi:serine/threonine-protein kinase